MKYFELIQKVNSKTYIFQIVMTITLIGLGLLNEELIRVIGKMLKEIFVYLKIVNVALAYKVFVMVGSFIIVKSIFALITLILFLINFYKGMPEK